MNINVTQDQLTELNQMLGLLKSHDLESRVLGFEMFKNSELLRNKLYDLCYESKQGKTIPLSWYIRKCEEEITNHVRQTDSNNTALTCSGIYNFASLIIPIIQSILLCEPKFTARITFNIDKFELMKHYTPNGVFRHYQCHTDDEQISRSTQTF